MKNPGCQTIKKPIKKLKRTGFKMNAIVGIIDMDGFMANKKFYCRELGMININENNATSYHFNTGLKWADLTPKDRKCCAYVCRHLVKLSLTGHQELALSNLSTIVKDLYNGLKTSETSTLAYKGGHVEKDLLRELKIPAVNLESFGCPKADHLFDELIWLETCGKHFGIKTYRHCPKVEVEAYALWLKNNTLNYYVKNIPH